MSTLSRLTKQLFRDTSLYPQQQRFKAFDRAKRIVQQKRCLTAKPFTKGTRKASKNPNPETTQQNNINGTQQQPKTFTWKSAVVLAMTAAGLLVYFKHEKERIMIEKAKRQKAKIKALGKPNIGCQPFELYNVNEQKRMTSESLLQGHFSLIYFGFTHCPDICPEELDKMAEVMDAVSDKEQLQGIFITCDPLRDTADVVKEYVQDFHPRLIGLTGNADELKKVARSYRVYSYVPPNVNVEDDYLVDHSIFIYLMDPQGQFVDCYSRDTSAKEVIESVKDYMQDYLKSYTK